MDYLLVASAYLLTISLVTYFVYGIDKKKARNDERRVSEETLHLLAVFGGSVAAFYAQRHFRHKTKKLSFQIVYWIIVFLQIAISFFVYTTFIRQ